MNRLNKNINFLNLDDAEDGNLIQTNDKDKTTNEKEKVHSITTIWNFEMQNYFLKKCRVSEKIINFLKDFYKNDYLIY